LLSGLYQFSLGNLDPRDYKMEGWSLGLKAERKRFSPALPLGAVWLWTRYIIYLYFILKCVKWGDSSHFKLLLEQVKI
jgi:hypothetical protein